MHHGCSDDLLRIIYENSKVKKFFEDYGEMKKKLPADWVRTIRKHIVRLEAADNFGDFLKLGIGRPEELKGKNKGKYSVRVSGNVRLVMKPTEKGDAVMICEEIVMEGVVDYHGDKETWYIP